MSEDHQDRNASVEVSMWEDDDSERAYIELKSWAGVSELRFEGWQLVAVASLASLDVRRLLDAIKAAEKKRVDPNKKMIQSLDYVMDRIDLIDEDKQRLWLSVEAEMPIASSGSVFLKPNLGEASPAAKALEKKIRERDNPD